MPTRVRASLRVPRTPRPATTFCVYGGAGCGSAEVSRSLRGYQVSVIFPGNSRSPTHHACGRAAEGSSQNQGRRPVRKSKNQISATTIAIATMAASRPFGVFCSVIPSDYGGRGRQSGCWPLLFKPLSAPAFDAGLASTAQACKSSSRDLLRHQESNRTIVRDLKSNLVFQQTLGCWRP
jgi:hypothetical protein